MPHQDNSFIYTEPQTCTGLWLALEDATLSNGCLWAIPGSHKSSIFFPLSGLFLTRIIYPLPRLIGSNHFSFLFYSMVAADGLVRKFYRDEDGVKFDRPSPSYDKKDFVPIEVKAGSLVVIHGNLIHQRLVKPILPRQCISFHK